MAAGQEMSPPSVAAVEVKLQSLLQHAREVKVVDTVEPPLPASEFIAPLSALGKDTFDTQTKLHRHVVLEAAARNIFYSTVRSTSIEDSQFVRVWDLLDILIVCSDQDQCESILPFYLIEELLETQTTDRCRIVFDYLESRRERLLQKEFYKTHLVVLRACNELLRRLSRAEDAVFCGRVFFFLFQSFPLGDKSSVNLRGEFHVDNVTAFEKNLEASTTPAETMEVDASVKTPNPDGRQDNSNAQTPTTTGSAPSPDENSRLYATFWKLQQDFSMPTRLFEESHFTSFKQGLESTMDKFRKTPDVVQTKAVVDDQPRGTKRKIGDTDGEKLNNNYNPKYLTSRDLFELELSDLAFQRHILVQALILIDFLLSLTEKAKKKITDANIPKVNLSLVYQYTLSDEKKDWVLSTRSEIANYLEQGPDGKFYYRMVNTVLSRDKNWVRWKVENCPTIVMDAITSEEYLQARASAKRATANRRIRAKPIGAIDLTFLVDANNTSGQARLKDRTRFSPPSIESLIKGIDNDELDLEMAMDDDEKHSLETSIASKKWRAMRTATRTSLEKLDKVEAGKSLKTVIEHGAVEPAGDGTQVVMDGKADDVS